MHLHKTRPIRQELRLHNQQVLHLVAAKTRLHLEQPLTQQQEPLVLRLPFKDFGHLHLEEQHGPGAPTSLEQHPTFQQQRLHQLLDHSLHLHQQEHSIHMQQDQPQPITSS